MNAPAKIAFVDLAAQQRTIRDRLDAAMAAVLDTGAYIMGPEVKQLEAELAAFCGARHVLTCGNGTDALQLVLMALGIGPGDAVFVPSFTFAATAEVVPLVGATPVFVDSDSGTCNMHPESLDRGIDVARRSGLEPRAVIPVDLFGLPADLPAIEAIAAKHGLTVLCDSAQGFGGRIDNRTSGTFGKVTTTSFFPAKPLGCYGDGGAVFTDDDKLAEIIDSLRVHGKGSDKYDNVRVGLNSRLDTLQAAILRVKLSIYPAEIEARERVARRYSEGLSDLVETPVVPEGYASVWAQYTVKLADPAQREQVQGSLAAAGVPTVVYYPVPLHRQRAYVGYPCDPQGLPVSEDLSRRVLSLPMHPYLEEDTQERIITAFRHAVAAAGRI